MNKPQTMQLVPVERVERLIQLMRAFVSLRRMLAGNEALAGNLAAPPANPPREIGFHVKEDSVPYRVHGSPRFHFVFRGQL